MMLSMTLNLNPTTTPITSLSHSVAQTHPLNSVAHYENFPVASLLLPKRCVPAVQALYRFARAGDDIADEGIASTAERLEQLHALHAQLHQPDSLSNSVLVRDLAPFIADGTLPVQYLQALLAAFIQDVQQDAVYLTAPDTPRHASLASLLDYCSRSANPVGRLMLHCVGAPCTAASFAASDAICTSLQLINFWQDVAKDQNAAIARVYIPHDMFVRYGSPLPNTPNHIAMMRELCTDAQHRMRQGLDLLPMLRGRFKLEIALTVAGGWRVLDKLAACDYDVINRRPRLGWRDAPACLAIVWRLYRRRVL
jgi:squalene synthase HpnC